MMDNVAMLWGLAIVAGTVALGVAIAIGQMKSAKADRQADPNTPGDDPSKGMR